MKNPIQDIDIRYSDEENTRATKDGEVLVCNILLTVEEAEQLLALHEEKITLLRKALVPARVVARNRAVERLWRMLISEAMNVDSNATIPDIWGQDPWIRVRRKAAFPEKWRVVSYDVVPKIEKVRDCRHTPNGVWFAGKSGTVAHRTRDAYPSQFEAPCECGKLVDDDSIYLGADPGDYPVCAKLRERADKEADK